MLKVSNQRLNYPVSATPTLVTAALASSQYIWNMRDGAADLNQAFSTQAVISKLNNNAFGGYPRLKIHNAQMHRRRRRLKRAHAAEEKHREKVWEWCEGDVTHKQSKEKVRLKRKGAMAGK